MNENTGLLQSDLNFALCGDAGIEFSGQTFTPDNTKGYFKFHLSHAFPVSTVYGQGVLASVVGKSYKTLLHQNVNFEHQLQVYHKKPGEPSNVHDRVIGSVVAVDFPPAPMSGWRMSADLSKSPGITGIGVFYKMTQGMAKIIGEHQAGRHQYTVSMEVNYPIEDSGFAVKRGDKDEFKETTPADMHEAGWEYVPWSKAPDKLIETFSVKKNRITSAYKGRQPVILMGGLNGMVHYAGVGMVKYGAEPTAKISRLTAAAPDLTDPFQSLAELFGSVLKQT